MKQLTSFPDWLAVGGASCRNPCFGGVVKPVSKIEEGYARMRIAELKVSRETHNSHHVVTCSSGYGKGY
jgi:hypothetical protein